METAKHNARVLKYFHDMLEHTGPDQYRHWRQAFAQRMPSIAPALPLIHARDVKSFPHVKKYLIHKLSTLLQHHGDAVHRDRMSKINGVR